MIDQQTRRQPGFYPGISVRLADGQFWIFPVPTRSTLETSAEDIPRDDSHERAYHLILEAIAESENDSDQFLGELALAIQLLGNNYALADDDFRALLSFNQADPGRASLRKDLHSVALSHLRAGHCRVTDRSTISKWTWRVPHWKSQRDQARMSDPAA